MLVGSKDAINKKNFKYNKKGSIETSFENNVSLKDMQDKQIKTKKLIEDSMLQKEIMMRNKKKNGRLDIDEDMVKTYESFQSNFGFILGKLINEVIYLYYI